VNVFAVKTIFIYILVIVWFLMDWMSCNTQYLSKYNFIFYRCWRLLWI